jgi:membrane-bound lytic murein transglycosylase D
MQLLMNSSKYLVLVVLSCVFLLVFYGADTSIVSLGSIDNYSTLNNFDLDNMSSGPMRAPVINKLVQSKVDSSSVTIWRTIATEFNLDHNSQSVKVQSEIKKLLADRNKLYDILQSSSPYIYFIHKQIQEHGLPAEIALIPVIESEFNPNDHSNKGATGLWQLMPGTAHELGIKVKSNYDGRRNVIASTNAAMAYLRDLGKYYKGNWYLALAAYNCGQAKVESALRRAGSHNFWNLKLPRETQFYIPKLLAVAEIVKNPAKYGMQLPSITNQPYFAEIKFNKSINLENIAKTSGVSLAQLHVLNPDYKRGMVSVKNVYSLLVPVDYVSRMQSRFANNIIFA